MPGGGDTGLGWGFLTTPLLLYPGANRLSSISFLFCERTLGMMMQKKTVQQEGTQGYQPLRTGSWQQGIGSGLATSMVAYLMVLPWALLLVFSPRKDNCYVSYGTIFVFT